MRPVVAWSALGGLAVFIASMMVMVSLPFRLQQHYGFPPGEVGALLTPWPLAILLIGPTAGSAVGSLSSRDPRRHRHGDRHHRIVVAGFPARTGIALRSGVAHGALGRRLRAVRGAERARDRPCRAARARRIGGRPDFHHALDRPDARGDAAGRTAVARGRHRTGAGIAGRRPGGAGRNLQRCAPSRIGADSTSDPGGALEAVTRPCPRRAPDSFQVHSQKRTRPCRSMVRMLEQRVPYPGARTKALDSNRSHATLTPVRGSSASSAWRSSRSRSSNAAHPAGATARR